MQEAYTPAVPWRHPASRRAAAPGRILIPAPTALLFGLHALLDARVGVPYDGVREMLAALSAAGYPLGLVGVSSREVESAFAPAIFEVAARDHEALPSAAARLRIPVGSVAFIGASLSDLSAGLAAGMPVGVALWCCEAFDDVGSRWSFERPADVTRAFARWC